MPETKIPILTYHSIDESGSVISVSPAKFKEHMETLKDAGFQSVSLKEIVDCILERHHFPEKSIAITFDDGFKNNYSEALPILKELGFTATIFLVSGKCSGENEWDRQLGSIPTLDLLSWDEVTKMSELGIEFGAHTLNHVDLAVTSKEKALEEIVSSKSMIHEHLNKDVAFFAYPYGRESRESQAIVKNEFKGAFSDKMGVATLESDIYSLPRIEMFYFSGNNLFTWINKPFFNIYIQYRGMLRNIRKIIKIGHLKYSSK